MLDCLVKDCHAVHPEALIESEIRLECDTMRSGGVYDALVELKHGLPYRPAGLHALRNLCNVCVKTDTKHRTFFLDLGI